MDHVPLLNHPLNEPTAFTPEALLDAVRAERGLANEPAPPICVLDFDGDLTDHLIANGRARRRETWPCFHTAMFALKVEGVDCGMIPRTIGGPYAVLIAEQLAAAGAKIVFGLASAGRVLADLPIPSLVIATSAVRDEGTSFHYLPPGERVDAPAGVPDCLETELRRLDAFVTRGPVWTTDAPYRETQQQLDGYAAAGILAVEMQAASLFSFAARRKFPVGLVAQVSNAVDHDNRFNKGSAEESGQILEAMCRAGKHILGNSAAEGTESPMP